MKKFVNAIPFLPVRDLKQTIGYYRDILGFTDEWFWEDTDAGISRDDINCLFTKNPELAERINDEEKSLELVWLVENAEEIFLEYSDKGTEIISPIEVKPWKAKEFTFRDINGYLIRVSESL